MGGATKTSTRLVNETDKVLHLYVESAGENYFFKRTLKARKHDGAADWFVEEFDANCTYRKLRIFEGAGNRVTDVSISSDDMIDYREIAITAIPDGSFALRCTPRFDETLSRGFNEGKPTWTQSFMNKLYWLKGPSCPMPKQYKC